MHVHVHGQEHVCLLPKMPLEGLAIVGKERVDKSEELHHSLILTQIFVAFQKEHVTVAVTTYKPKKKHKT